MQYRQIDPHRFAFIKPGGLTQPLPVVVTTGPGGPPGLSDFILHLQPRPSTSAEDVPTLRAWNQSTQAQAPRSYSQNNSPPSHALSIHRGSHLAHRSFCAYRWARSADRSEMIARSTASVHRLVLAVHRARAQSAAADGARARNRLLESASVKRHFQSTREYSSSGHLPDRSRRRLSSTSTSTSTTKSECKARTIV